MLGRSLGTLILLGGWGQSVIGGGMSSIDEDDVASSCCIGSCGALDGEGGATVSFCSSLLVLLLILKLGFRDNGLTLTVFTEVLLLLSPLVSS